MLAALDLNAPEAKPIVKMLEDIPSALRFILENNLDHLRDVGQNTEAPCAKVCALIFGKDESGEFAFNQAMVDGVAADLFFWFSGRVVGSFGRAFGGPRGAASTKGARRWLRVLPLRLSRGATRECE